MKYLLILLFGCLTFASFSQLDIKENTTQEKEIGSANIMGTMWMSCKEYKDSSSVQYIFLYRNTKYTAITDYKSFWMQSQEDFNQLYQILSDGNAKREEKDLEIKLKNGDELTLSFHKNGSVIFKVWNGTFWSYSYPFKQKHIDKIFGKA